LQCKLKVVQERTLCQCFMEQVIGFCSVNTHFTWIKGLSDDWLGGGFERRRRVCVNRVIEFVNAGIAIPAVWFILTVFLSVSNTIPYKKIIFVTLCIWRDKLEICPLNRNYCHSRSNFIPLMTDGIACLRGKYVNFLNIHFPKIKPTFQYFNCFLFVSNYTYQWNQLKQVSHSTIFVCLAFKQALHLHCSYKLETVDKNKR
jgi:hypothetical protein